MSLFYRQRFGGEFSDVCGPGVVALLLSEHILWICDVDTWLLEGAGESFPCDGDS